jgi:hypothetical protein
LVDDMRVCDRGWKERQTECFRVERTREPESMSMWKNDDQPQQLLRFLRAMPALVDQSVQGF